MRSASDDGWAFIGQDIELEPDAVHVIELEVEPPGADLEPGDYVYVDETDDGPRKLVQGSVITPMQATMRPSRQAHGTKRPPPLEERGSTFLMHKAGIGCGGVGVAFGAGVVALTIFGAVVPSAGLPMSVVAFGLVLAYQVSQASTGRWKCTECATTLQADAIECHGCKRAVRGRIRHEREYDDARMAILEGATWYGDEKPDRLGSEAP